MVIFHCYVSSPGGNQLNMIWMCLKMGYADRSGNLNRKTDDLAMDLGLPNFQTFSDLSSHKQTFVQTCFGSDQQNVYPTVGGQNIQNPATQSVLNPRTPKSQCCSALVSKSDVGGLISFVHWGYCPSGYIYT